MAGCLATLFLLVCGIAGIWAVIKMISEAAEERKREAARAANKRRAQEEERQRDQAEQAKLRVLIDQVNEDSLKALEAMPATVESAEKFLDRAEMEFTAGAFAPFWDAIERAASTLAKLDQDVRQIGQGQTSTLLW